MEEKLQRERNRNRVNNENEFMETSTDASTEDSPGTIDSLETDNPEVYKIDNPSTVSVILCWIYNLCKI